MLDIGWQELFIIAVIAIVVVGPKDLPRVLAVVMKWVRKARGMAREFQSGIDEVVREAELEDIKKQVEDGSNFDIGKEIENAIDPDGDMGNEFRGLEKDLDTAAKTASAEAVESKPQVAPPLPEEYSGGRPEDEETASVEDTRTLDSGKDAENDKKDEQATG
ncbi:MAG: Sec-independent protein translocase protein TatB [Rhodospirillales bacterium]|nr:Sec-independent protein translocase protein TatB [Rhodospirillales bacterium]